MKRKRNPGNDGGEDISDKRTKRELNDRDRSSDSKHLDYDDGEFERMMALDVDVEKKSSLAVFSEMLLPSLGGVNKKEGFHTFPGVGLEIKSGSLAHAELKSNSIAISSSLLGLSMMRLARKDDDLYKVFLFCLQRFLSPTYIQPDPSLSAEQLLEQASDRFSIDAFFYTLHHRVRHEVPHYCYLEMIEIGVAALSEDRFSALIEKYPSTLSAVDRNILRASFHRFLKRRSMFMHNVFATIKQWLISAVGSIDHLMYCWDKVSKLHDVALARHFIVTVKGLLLNDLDGDYANLWLPFNHGVLTSIYSDVFPFPGDKGYKKQLIILCAEVGFDLEHFSYLELLGVGDDDFLPSVTRSRDSNSHEKYYRGIEFSQIKRLSVNDLPVLLYADAKAGLPHLRRKRKLSRRLYDDLIESLNILLGVSGIPDIIQAYLGCYLFPEIFYQPSGLQLIPANSRVAAPVHNPLMSELKYKKFLKQRKTRISYHIIQFSPFEKILDINHKGWPVGLHYIGKKGVLALHRNCLGPDYFLDLFVDANHYHEFESTFNKAGGQLILSAPSAVSSPFCPVGFLRFSVRNVFYAERVLAALRQMKLIDQLQCYQLLDYNCWLLPLGVKQPSRRMRGIYISLEPGESGAGQLSAYIIFDSEHKALDAMLNINLMMRSASCKFDFDRYYRYFKRARNRAIPMQAEHAILIRQLGDNFKAWLVQQGLSLAQTKSQIEKAGIVPKR